MNANTVICDYYSNVSRFIKLAHIDSSKVFNVDSPGLVPAGIQPMNLVEPFTGIVQSTWGLKVNVENSKNDDIDWNKIICPAYNF